MECTRIFVLMPVHMLLQLCRVMIAPAESSSRLIYPYSSVPLNFRFVSYSIVTSVKFIRYIYFNTFDMYTIVNYLRAVYYFETYYMYNFYGGCNEATLNRDTTKYFDKSYKQFAARKKRSSTNVSDVFLNASSSCKLRTTRFLQGILNSFALFTHLRIAFPYDDDMIMRVHFAEQRAYTACRVSTREY